MSTEVSKSAGGDSPVDGTAFDRALFQRLVALGMSPGSWLVEVRSSMGRGQSELAALASRFCDRVNSVPFEWATDEQEDRVPGDCWVLRRPVGLRDVLRAAPRLVAVVVRQRSELEADWPAISGWMGSAEWTEIATREVLLLRRRPEGGAGALGAAEKGEIEAEAGGAKDGALQEELRAYDDCVDVHDLPPIYHYWSERAVRPLFESLGYRDLGDFLVSTLEAALEENPVQRIVSLGAGNCDLEMDLAERLAERGRTGFVIECLELNERMVARARADIDRRDLTATVEVRQMDLAGWRAEGPLAACLANHSLHHLVPLEELFSEVRRALAERGRFVVNDMVGRNGHMRWPEVLEEVERIWSDLPDRYKFQHQLQQQHDRFVNWDCAREGFEGVRAQDILPLLLEEFHCEQFVAFGAVVDVFVDRGYGHNYSPEQAEDVAWIDRIAALDQQLLDDGRLKPTHLVGSFVNFETPCRCVEPRTPLRSVRVPEDLYRRRGEAHLRPLSEQLTRGENS